MWQIEQVICIGLLVGSAFSDIWFRNIPVIILIAGSALGVVNLVTEGWAQWPLYVLGLGIGILFLIISWTTREALGYGDSWMICNIGLYLGIWELFEVLLISWGLLSIVAAFYLVRKKWSRKAVLPFIPFLTAGYLLVMIGGWM